MIETYASANVIYNDSDVNYIGERSIRYSDIDDKTEIELDVEV